MLNYRTRRGDRTREVVYDFIVRFKRQHDGLSPTVRLIAEGVGLGTSTVHFQLGVLQHDGLIRRTACGIEVKGGEWRVAGVDRDGEGCADGGGLAGSLEGVVAGGVG